MTHIQEQPVLSHVHLDEMTSQGGSMAGVGRSERRRQGFGGLSTGGGIHRSNELGLLQSGGISYAFIVQHHRLWATVSTGRPRACARKCLSNGTQTWSSAQANKLLICQDAPLYFSIVK